MTDKPFPKSAAEINVLVPSENWRDAIQQDGSVFTERFPGPYLWWPAGTDIAVLEGNFTSRELRAIADHMDLHNEEEAQWQ